MQLPSKSRSVRAPQDDRGFTLIELMVASMILMIGVLAVASAVGLSVKYDSMSKHDSVALTLAETRLERLKAMQFTDVNLVGGSETVPVASADQSGRSVNYSVTWTVTSVAIVSPAPGVKYITVSALRTGGNGISQYPAVRLSYIKAP